ncbi:MAG: hypothetical protein V9F00_17710 [Nocardioides sp.]
MTATPHSGKEEDFQLFLTLLDRDRFEGKSTKSADLDGVMRRLTKEDLLTFEGKKLFPERIAETVPYELTALEYDLYEDVTHYVREGMNRAEKLGGKRKNTVGFALTVLQRRLASSPEAIYRSLVRRSERLERKKQEILNGTYSDTDPKVDLSDLDSDDFNAEEIEEIEEELLDAATAAQTVEELNAELIELADLTKTAKQVRDIGHRPQVDRTVHDPPRQCAHHRRERVAAQVHHLHRAPRHPRLPPSPDHITHRQARCRPRDPRRCTPRRASSDHRGVHQEPRLSRSCSPPTPPVRDSTSRPRT